MPRDANVPGASLPPALSSDRPPRGANGGRARRIRETLSDLRFEIAIVALLLLTVAAIGFGDRILSNTLVIDRSNAAAFVTEWHGDATMGGSSTATADPRRRPLSWSCELRTQYKYPYCSYEIRLDRRTNRGVDLSRFQTITVALDYRGPADSLRLNLRNFDPRYSRASLADSPKYNQIVLPVEHGRELIEARLADFKVADWWIEKYRVPYRLSRTQFDNVIGIQINTGTGALPGRHDIRIRSVVLHGRILPIEKWYLGILGCWIVLICLFLISRIVDLQRDLSRRRALQDVAVGEARRALEFARRDHLTGLFNRLGVSDRYRQMVASGSGKAVAIMLIDVDHFKGINDRFGHARGDEILCAFAAVLRQNTREDDLIGRWGGEEFLLAVRVGDEHAAAEIANKLRARIEATDFAVDGPLTASFGVYYSAHAEEDLAAAVACADIALYAAKEEGRNRVVLYRRPTEPASPPVETASPAR